MNCPMRKEWGFLAVDVAVIGIGGWALTMLLRAPSETIRMFTSILTLPGDPGPAIGFGFAVLYSAILFIGGAYFALLASCRINEHYSQIRWFRLEFGFSPPTTPDGVKALQNAVDAKIKERAMWLKRIYLSEEQSRERLHALSTSLLPQQLKQLAGAVAAEEARIKSLKGMVKHARECFYGARDIARSKHLPVPFQVKEKLEEYL